MAEEKNVVKRRRISVKRKTQNSTAPKKLKMLITVVNRSKAEFYSDLLEEFEINMQLHMHASGTANSETLHYLGLEDSDKAVLFSIVREDKAGAALRMLETKFTTVRGGKGVAYTVPLSSAMGVAIYSFLANATEAVRDEQKESRKER